MAQPEHESASTASGAEALHSETTFDGMYGRFALGETSRIDERGVETTVRAYELLIDAADQTERRGLLVAFCLRAVEAGYRQAFASVTLPQVGYRDTAGQHPLTGVYFFLEKPIPAPRS